MITFRKSQNIWNVTIGMNNNISTKKKIERSPKGCPVKKLDEKLLNKLPEWITDFKGTRKLKFKTIGKLVDNVITMEGLFTVVLFTDINMNGDKEVQYRFQTNQTDGGNTCKSPMGMFSETYIPNDMGSVIETINNYYK